MIITGVSSKASNGRVFYVKSDNQGEYAVRYTRRQGAKHFTCSCPDYFFRREQTGRHCKHIHTIVHAIRYWHGVRRLANVVLQASKRGYVVPFFAGTWF